LADDLGEERDSAVQKVIVEAFELFAPLARREWLSWGGELLFSDLAEQVEREEREAAEAKARAEAEAAEAKRLEDEERARRDAAAAKAAKLQGRKAALLAARSAALAGFRAKTLSKEDLQLRNAELAAEAKAIEREEVEGEVEKEEDEEEEADDLPVVRVAKRKAEIFEDDEEEVDQLEEDGVDAKRAKFASSGLLDFEGAVSFRFSISLLDLLTNPLLSVIDARTSSQSHPVSSRKERPSASSALSKRKGVIGKECRGRGIGRGRGREAGLRRAFRVQNQVRRLSNRVRNGSNTFRGFRSSPTSGRRACRGGRNGRGAFDVAGGHAKRDETRDEGEVQGQGEGEANSGGRRGRRRG
jgi:hypothetical protein